MSLDVKLLTYHGGGSGTKGERVVKVTFRGNENSTNIWRPERFFVAVVIYCEKQWLIRNKKDLNDKKNN